MSRTALVTGGTRGIGRAISVALAESGVSVVGLHYGFDEAAAKETAELVETAGATAVLIRADLAKDPAGTAAGITADFLAAAAEHTGERVLDILVNNAGVANPQDLADIDEATYRQTLDVNLTAPLFLIQNLAPHIRDNGRIVNVSTGFTRVAAPTHPAYAASKAALNSLTLSLAPTLGDRGITINAVMPGVIDTDMNAGWLNEPGARDHAAGLSVFNRIGAAGDVAELVRYLASPAAGWTTGQTIDVTGGSQI